MRAAAARERIARRAVEPVASARSRSGLRDLEIGGARRRHAVEPPRVFEHRRIAARANVVEDRGDRAIDRLVLRASKAGERGETGVEVGLARWRGVRSQAWAATAVSNASISGCSRSRFSLSAAWFTIRRLEIGHDLLHRVQRVGAQRVAGGDQVDDRVGEPGQRREFHRAVQPDEVDVHALRGEVLARDLQILGGDAQPRALPHRVRVVEAVAAPRPPCGTRRS